MKKTIRSLLAVALACTAFAAKAQQKQDLAALQKQFACRDQGSQNAIATVVSKEEMVVTGNFEITLSLRSFKNITIEDIEFQNTAFLSASASMGNSVDPPSMQSVFGTASLGEQEGAEASIYINHPTTNLPYYPTTLTIKVKTRDNEEEGASSKYTSVSVQVYFTPYNSVEIWSQQDFMKLPRVWATPRGAQPPRVFIPREDIPESTRPAVSEITAEWQKNFQVERIPGLPYLIQMRAVHPDTIRRHRELDSLAVVNGQPGSLGKGVFGNTFNGTITGKLVANYINDNGVPVTLGLEGVKIAAYDEDVTYDETLSHAHTGGDGSFNLSYSNWESPFEGSEIELFIQWWSENDYYDLDVIKDGTYNSTFNISFSHHLWLGNVGTSYTNHMGNLVLGSNPAEAMSRDPYKILNWATKAYKFTRTMIKPGGAPDGLNIYAYDDDNITGGTSYCFPIEWGGHPYISLATKDMNHESTIWHEFGHFAMYYLQNSNYLFCSTDEHKWTESSNTELSWTEGWATGFGRLLDIYYRYTDGESIYEKDSEAPGVFNDWMEFRKTSVYANASTTNGFRSEYFIATFIHDLFDGAYNYNSQSTIPVDEYSDYSSSFTTLSYLNNERDDLQLTAMQICKPLTDGPMPTSIVEYFNSLLEFSNCEDKKKIVKVAFQNGIKPDYTLTTSKLSGDAIGINHTTTTYTCPLLGNSVELTVNATQDINLLNSTSLAFNLAKERKYHIIDPLTVTQSSLGVNANMPQGFSNGPANPVNNLLVTAEACNTTYVNTAGNIAIGGPTTPGHYVLKSGASIVLNSGSTLMIHNNSQLTVEAGATLVFNQGASVNLVGQTSVIIVKPGGKLQIGSNAVFNYSGNGYLKFETTYPYSASIQALGPNAKFALNGGPLGDRSKKLLEITGAEALTDLTTSHPQGADYNLAGFSLDNGHIVLSKNSRLVVSGSRTIARLSYLNIFAKTQQNEQERHRGVILNGQPGNSIYNINVTDATTGITCNNMYGGADADVLQLRAERCGTGLEVNGAGARVMDPTMTKCVTGISFNGMTRTTRCIRPKLYDNKTGVSASLCNTTVIELIEPTIYYNYYGAYAYSSQFTSTCGMIANNKAASPVGGKYDGANVYLAEKSNYIADPSMRPYGGRTDMSNWFSVAIRQRDASHGPYITNARVSLLTQNDYSITGRIYGSAASNNITASNNLWNMTGNTSAIPAFGIDHFVLYRAGLLTGFPVFYTDNTPILFSGCGSGGGGGGGGTVGGNPPGNEKMKGPLDGGVSFVDALPSKTTNNGMDVRDAINKGYESFFKEGPDQYDAVMNLADALNVSIGEGELETWVEAMAVVNNQMIEALSEGLAEGSIPKMNPSETGYSELVMNALGIQDHLIEKFSSFPDYVFAFKISQTTLYRIIGDYDKALSILYNIDPQLSPDLNPLKEHYLCLARREQAMVNQLPLELVEEGYYCTPIEDFASLPPHGGEGEGGGGGGGVTPEPVNISEMIVNLYPNPTEDGQFSLQFKATPDEAYEIAIFDLLGRSVYDAKGKTSAFNNLHINLGELKPGTYFLKLSNKDQAVVKQILIL